MQVRTAERSTPIPAPAPSDVYACGYSALRGVMPGDILDVWGPCEVALEWTATDVCH